MFVSSIGVVVFDSSFRPLFGTAGALEVFCRSDNGYGAYPSKDAIARDRLAQMMRADDDEHVLHFKVDGVGYRCIRFPLQAVAGGSHPLAAFALVIAPDRDDSRNIELLAGRYNLSPRELETLRCVLEGLTTEETAARLGISVSTTKSFMRYLNIKLGVSGRTAIMAKVMRATDHA